MKTITLKVMLTGDKETYLVKSKANTVAQVHIGEPMFEAITEALKNTKPLVDPEHFLVYLSDNHSIVIHDMIVQDYLKYHAIKD
jgi:hypothetical protein